MIVEGPQIKRGLPVGSEIEVAIEINQSRLVLTKAYIPLLDQEFEAELVYDNPPPKPEQLRTSLDAEKARLEKVREQARTTNDPKAQEIIQRIDAERMVHDVEAALDAARGDPDAPDRCDKRLHDLRQAIDDAEDALDWPTAVAEAHKEVADTKEIVDEYGTADDKQNYAALKREIEQMIQTSDTDLLRAKVAEITGLRYRVLREQPGFWVAFLENLEERKSEMRDPDQADMLFQQGRRAINSGDVPGLKSAVQQLLALLPVEAQEQVRSGFGSGVL